MANTDIGVASGNDAVAVGAAFILFRSLTLIALFEEKIIVVR